MLGFSVLLHWYLCKKNGMWIIRLLEKGWENLSVFLKLRLRKTLAFNMLRFLKNNISDAIGDAYTLLLMKAPAEIKGSAPRQFRWLLSVASRKAVYRMQTLARFVPQNDCIAEYSSSDLRKPFETSETIRALMECLSPLLKETGTCIFKKVFPMKRSAIYLRRM